MRFFVKLKIEKGSYWVLNLTKNSNLTLRKMKTLKEILRKQEQFSEIKRQAVMKCDCFDVRFLFLDILSYLLSL